MQHALRVRRRQTGAQLPGDVDHLLGRQAADAAEQRREILARARAPSRRRLVSSASPTSNTRHTAGCVICRASRTSLRMRSRVRRRWPHAISFSATGVCEHQVVGAPDVAHAAAADARDHAVAAGEDARRARTRRRSRRRSGCRRSRVVVVELEQRFDFLPQGGIARARLLDEAPDVRPRSWPPRRERCPSRACRTSCCEPDASATTVGRLRHRVLAARRLHALEGRVRAPPEREEPFVCAARRFPLAGQRMRPGPSEVRERVQR